MAQAAGKETKMSSKKRSTERSVELAAWEQGDLIESYIHPELAQQGIKQQDYQLNNNANAAQDLMNALISFEQQACELEGLSQHQQAIHEFSQGIKHLWESGSLPDDAYDASVLQHILGGHSPASDGLLEPEIDPKVDAEVEQVETYACRFYESVLTHASDSPSLSDTARMLWMDFKSHDPFRRNAANFALVSSRYIQAGGEYNHEYLAELLKQTDNDDLLTEDVGVTDIETLGSVTHAIKRGTLSIGHVFATNNPEAQTQNFVSDVEKYREAIQAVNEEELKERLNERAEQQVEYSTNDKADDKPAESEQKQAIPIATYEQFAALISDVYNCLTQALSVGSIQAQKQAMSQKQDSASNDNLNDDDKKAASASKADVPTHLNHHEQQPVNVKPSNLKPSHAAAVNNTVFSLPNKPVVLQEPVPVKPKEATVVTKPLAEPVAKSPQSSVIQTTVANTEPKKVDKTQATVEPQKPVFMVEEPKQTELTEKEIVLTLEPMEVVKHQPHELDTSVKAAINTDHISHVTIVGDTTTQPTQPTQPKPVVISADEKVSSPSKLTASVASSNNARQDKSVVSTNKPSKKASAPIQEVEIETEVEFKSKVSVDVPINTKPDQPIVSVTDESPEAKHPQAAYDSTLMYESIFEEEVLQEALDEEVTHEFFDEDADDIRYKLSEMSELFNASKESTTVESKSTVMNKVINYATNDATNDATQVTHETQVVDQTSVNTRPDHSANKQHELMPLSFAASLYAGQAINDDDLLVQMVEQMRFDYHSNIASQHDTAMFALIAVHYNNVGGGYNYQQFAWLLNATGNGDLLYEGIGQQAIQTLAAIAFALQRGTLQLWQVFLHDSGLDAMGKLSILNAQAYRQAIDIAMNEADNPINQLITDFAPTQSQSIHTNNTQQNATTISSQDDFQRYISAMNQQGSLDQAVFTQQGAVPQTSARAYQLECLAAEYYAKARINTVQDMTDYAHTLWADFYAEQESYKSAGTFALVASRYREAGGEFDYEQLARLLEGTGHARFVTERVGQTELDTLGTMVDALRLGRLGLEDIFAGARGLDAMNKVSVKHGQLYQQAVMAIMQGDVSSDIRQGLLH